MFGFEKIIPTNSEYSFMSIRKLMLIISTVAIITSEHFFDCIENDAQP